MTNDLGRRGIHISDINSFRSCRFRWDIQSHLRQSLEPKKFTAPLWLGTGIHEALAALYGEGLDPEEAFADWAKAGKDAMKQIQPDMSDEEFEKVDQQVDLGLGMLAHYKYWYPDHDDFEVLAVEKMFRIPDFVKGEPLEGRGDGVIRRNGNLWILEHKTAITIETDRLILEEQPGSYQIGVQSRYDEPIIGTYYNFLRKKIPSIPKELVAGGLSKNKQIDTTWEVYGAEVRRLNLEIEDYLDMEQMLTLRQETKPFFYREEVVRSSRNLEILWGNMQATAHEMLDPNIAVYASPDPIKCKMCPVAIQGACIAYSDGQDPQDILRETMIPRTEVYASVVENEEVGWGG